MKYENRFVLPIPIMAILVIAGLIAHQQVVAGPLDTPTFSIPLVFDVHGYWSYGLNFGIHPSATKGIDASLGEEEYPPFPPAGGFTMFTTVEGNSILDLRPYASGAQIDTYKVGFAAQDAYPVSYSWPDLTPYYSGPVRLKSDLSGSLFNIDMKAQTSYTLATGPDGDFTVVYAYIIAEGPISTGNSLPVVSTFGLGNGGFQGIVNAPSASSLADGIFGADPLETNTWFEYGPTRDYGNITALQTVSNGSSMNISEPFDINNVPMDTRLHFRAVAQNSHGTFYGGDRIISRGTPPTEDTSGFVKYRTATYRDWADAMDQKSKRKAIKCKADKVEVKTIISAPADASSFKVNFGMPFTGTITLGTLKSTLVAIVNGEKELTVDSASTLGQTYQIDGFGAKGKPIKIEVEWRTGTKKTKTTSPYLVNQPRLPMPNLHNVGEDIYGGVTQTGVDITVATTSLPMGAHTVNHPKYKDVVKSLIKEHKGGNIYHTGLPHCLDTFDKNDHPINKKQKSLPPDKHNNSLFAEQLTLKLNIAASDSGIFPAGLGDLIYDNHGVKGTPGPFDGLTIRGIVDSVDRFLGCNGAVAGTTDSTEFYKVDSLINAAFEGPIDTTSWSCVKVICPGVRQLSDVAYLHANPSAVPLVIAPLKHVELKSTPREFALNQNYPNPFNPTTTLSFVLGNSSLVTLKVYNVLGQEVATVIDHELMDDGEQEVEFDGSNFASGVYFYRITAAPAPGEDDGENPLAGEPVSSVRKMILAK